MDNLEDVAYAVRGLQNVLFADILTRDSSDRREERFLLTCRFLESRGRPITLTLQRAYDTLMELFDRIPSAQRDYNYYEGVCSGRIKDAMPETKQNAEQRRDSAKFALETLYLQMEEILNPPKTCC